MWHQYLHPQKVDQGLSSQARIDADILRQLRGWRRLLYLLGI